MVEVEDRIRARRKAAALAEVEGKAEATVEAVSQEQKENPRKRKAEDEEAMEGENGIRFKDFAYADTPRSAPEMSGVSMESCENAPVEENQEHSETAKDPAPAVENGDVPTRNGSRPIVKETEDPRPNEMDSQRETAEAALPVVEQEDEPMDDCEET